MVSIWKSRGTLLFMGVGEDWICVDVEKENDVGEEDMRFFGHIVRKNGMEKRLMQGEMEGKRRINGTDQQRPGSRI